MRRNMPKKSDIAKYWYDILIDTERYWMDFYDDFGFNKNHVCFACGTEGIVQRCHIIPKHKNGADDINNIHLLCRECHIESEELCELVPYIEWFNLKPQLQSGSKIRHLNKAKILTTIPNEYIKRSCSNSQPTTPKSSV
jgi:5-methylcytosine-specific restriction endonuclease McrA